MNALLTPLEEHIWSNTFVAFDTLRPKENGSQFAGDISKCII